MYRELAEAPSPLRVLQVRPRSTEDVVTIVNIARTHRIPIVPYSGATSLEGHFAGYKTGSICIDMSEMNKIIRINGVPFPILVVFVCKSDISQWTTATSSVKPAYNGRPSTTRSRRRAFPSSSL